MDTTFQQFLEHKQERIRPERANLVERKQRWLESIDRLYSKVETFLQPYLKDGRIRLEREDVTLRERLLGEYRVPKLRIWFVDAWVDLLPSGTFVMDALGRVDIRGIKGSRMLIERKWNEWVVLGRPPEDREIELTQDYFEQLLMRFAA